MGYLDIISKTDCTGCSSCASGCPVKCISMTPDERGFIYPEVDRDICLQCGNCEAICPVFNKGRFQAPEESSFYECKNSDDSVRLASSSGGFFYELAKSVIDKGGVVFGVSFSDDFKKAYHIGAISMDDVRPMMVSKYVQSEIGKSFLEAKDYLELGKTVLFTGTPCQIAGIRSFLGEAHDNLILAEIVCHGVPSQKVWDIYLSGLEKEYGGKASFVTFRDKSRSWRQSDFRVVFDNGQTFVQPNRDNPYMKSFLRNLNLRDSCTNCKFKRFASGADITMGDFWGSAEFRTSYSDDIGTSVIALHTPMARKCFEDISQNLSGVLKIDEKVAFTFNESYKARAVKNQNADSFMTRVASEDFSSLVDELAPVIPPDPQKQRPLIIRLIRSVLSKIKNV